MEPTPADPTDETDAPDPNVPAPGSTEEPTKEPVPTAEPTVAPDPTDPDEGNVDPDMKTASVTTDAEQSPAHAGIALAAAPFLFLGMWRRRQSVK